MSIVYASTIAVPKDQVDTTFEVTVTNEAGTVVSLATAAPIQIVFRDPSGTETIVTASLTTDGTDGKMKYKDLTGALTNAVGLWKYWGKPTFGADGPYPSTPLHYAVVLEGNQ